MTLAHVPLHTHLPRVIQRNRSERAVKSSLVKCPNCSEPVLFGSFSRLFSVSARPSSNSREAAAAQKSPRGTVPPQQLVTSSLRDADMGHLSEVRGETEMRKDSALGRKAQSGLRQGASQEARTAWKGYRWGADKPVIRKLLCERAVLHRAGLRMAWH